MASCFVPTAKGPGPEGWRDFLNDACAESWRNQCSNGADSLGDWDGLLDGSFEIDKFCTIYHIDECSNRVLDINIETSSHSCYKNNFPSPRRQQEQQDPLPARAERRTRGGVAHSKWVWTLLRNFITEIQKSH